MKRKFLVLSILLLTTLSVVRGPVPAQAQQTSGRVQVGARMTIARAAHTATRLADGRVFIVGGMRVEGDWLRSTEFFDPNTDTFQSGPDAREPLVSQRVVTLDDGRLLFVGGWPGTLTANAQMYDPKTNTFSFTGAMSERRAAHTLTYLNDGRVLVTGGYNGTDAVDSAELYSPATGKFTPTAHLIAKRAAHTATLLPDGRVLIVGGAWRGYITDTAELFDPKTNTFTATGKLNAPRHKHAAVLLPSGDVLIIAGADIRDWTGQYRSVELYRTVRGIFEAVNGMQNARFKLTDSVALVENTDPDQIVIAGAGQTVETYDTARDMFGLSAGSVDSARYYMTATALTDGRVLIVGGYDRAIKSTDQAWLWSVR